MIKISAALTAVILCLASGRAYAMPYMPDPNATQYTQSCNPGRTWRMTTFNIPDCKAFTLSGGHVAQNVLIPWGSQWKVSNLLSGDEIRFCLHWTSTATVTAGGDVNDGSVDITYGTHTATNTQQKGRCITIAGADKDYIKLDKNGWIGVVTGAVGQCTAIGGGGTAVAKEVIGASCRRSADCGSLGTCSFSINSQPVTGRGIYASVCATATGHEVEINECLP